MMLAGAIELIPTDHAGDSERQTDELTVEAESYEKAFAELRASVPEGWRLMKVRRVE